MLVKAISACAVSALAIQFIGAARVPDLPMSAAGAMIYNPGGGDYSGFRIVIEPSGRARAVDGAGQATSELQSDLVAQFFDDLRAIGPLVKLPSQPCATNQSDAATTTVELNAANHH